LLLFADPVPALLGLGPGFLHAVGLLELPQPGIAVAVLPLVELGHPGPVSAIRLPLKPDVVGRQADVLPPDDDVGLLFSPVTLVAIKGTGFLVNFQLALKP